MKLVFTVVEVKEIILSAVVLSVAFAVAYSGGILELLRTNFANIPILVLFAFIAVGIGFLAHELIGHKLIAQRLGMHAEYRMWRFGLVIALLSSLAGFVFAAPGAVYVSPRIDLWGHAGSVSARRMGIVSLSGPIVNIVLTAIFFALNLFYPSDLFSLAVFVNIWLAIFNLLPVPPLDGSKVFAWNKLIWVAIFAVSVAGFVLLL